MVTVAPPSLSPRIVEIGALTRHVELERSPDIARHAPLIARAMPRIAHAAIRNRGTIGGSIAFADPAAELPACLVALGGEIDGQGWAVVEFNECWASGIYACDPERVLDTLLRACVPLSTMADVDRRWDFKEHYFAACS